MKVVPEVPSDDADTVPPWATTSSRTTASPIPVPAPSRSAEPRHSRWNTRSRSSGAMPGPVSDTVTIASSGVAVSVIATVSPARQ